MTALLAGERGRHDAVCDLRRWDEKRRLEVTHRFEENISSGQRPGTLTVSVVAARSQAAPSALRAPVPAGTCQRFVKGLVWGLTVQTLNNRIF